MNQVFAAIVDGDGPTPGAAMRSGTANRIGFRPDRMRVSRTATTILSIHRRRHGAECRRCASPMKSSRLLSGAIVRDRVTGVRRDARRRPISPSCSARATAIATSNRRSIAAASDLRLQRPWIF